MENKIDDITLDIIQDKYYPDNEIMMELEAALDNLIASGVTKNMQYNISLNENELTIVSTNLSTNTSVTFKQKINGGK